MKRLIPPAVSPPPVASPRGRLELRATLAWGVYAKATVCADCGDLAYCRAARRSGPFLCLGCWDQR